LTRKEDHSKNRSICLTFDYELSFGVSGTPEKSMLGPVAELLQVARANSLRFTLFVDATYLLRLSSRLAFKETLKAVSEQLREVLVNGHRIELHLHPSWMDAYYEAPYWHFRSQEHYRLHSLRPEAVLSLFREGKGLLEEIAKNVVPSYRVCAFRAGGWCLLPFEALRQGFIESGIWIDSSIAPFIRLRSAAHDVDYRKAIHLRSYRFSRDPLEEDERGEFVEVPISTGWIGVVGRIRRKQALQRCPVRGDGTGIKPHVPPVSRFLPSRTIATLDSCYDANPRMDLVTGHVAVYNSHPKLLNDLSFQALKSFGDSPTVTIDEVALHARQ
jgi:hypothetical protein